MKKTRRGFTLVELLAVVAIIAIIATIGLYAVTKIINNARMKVLNANAMAVKKAAKNYLSSGEPIIWDEGIAKLDMTPASPGIDAGDHADLLDISLDPWGDPYKNILAVVKQADEQDVTVYLTVGRGETFELTENADEVKELVYELNPLLITNNAKTGDTITVNFGLSEAYGMPTIEYCKPYENGVEENDTNLYSCGAVSLVNGYYQLPITLNHEGTFRMKIGFKTETEALKYQFTDEVVVTDNIVINMASNFTTIQNTNLSIPITINNNFAIESVKDEAGNTLIASPVAGVATSFIKNYATTGVKNEKVIVKDVKGNTATLDYTINVTGIPVISALSTTPGFKQMTISGSTVTSSPNPIAKWQYKIGAGAWVDIASSASNNMPSTVISSLTVQTSYTFTVRAVDNQGTASNERSASAMPTGWRVNYGAGAGGYISGNVSQEVAPGATATAVNAAPHAGYYFTGWVSHQGVWNYNASLTLPNITANATWTANFAADGSCPFIYVWDGTKYQFESDLYPKGRLGGATSRGYTKPQPNDLYILRNTPMLKNGLFEMKITTELPETHYTDEFKLYAIDLPKGTDVVTQQQQTNIDYPTINSALRTIGERRKIVNATIFETGEDITSKVSTTDGIYGIVNTNRNEPKYQSLDLDLGDLTGATNIKLITDAAAFTASSTEGRAKMLPTKPTIKVLNSVGEWVNINVIIDKPGEYQREYVVDLTNKFLTNTYKLRITYTNSIYFDGIYVDTTPEVSVTPRELPLISANLTYHGRNQEKVTGYLYKYEYQANARPFIAYLEGYYTRFGDVKPLLTGTDDKFVITGSGDEITTRFQPLADPVAEGMERHYLVYANGYYKYLLMPLEPVVGPLPFKAQSNYPYAPTEFYPADNDHNDYLNFYNTRWQPNTTWKKKTI